MKKFKIKIEKKKFLRLIFFALAIAIIISVPIIIAKNNSVSAQSREDMTVLTIWQIDGFEGGKGSRATYLQNIGDKFSKNGGCYISVYSLSSEAAQINLKNGNMPDLISYGAGMCGIENIISDADKPFYNWCHGGYCFLSVDTAADFADISTKNLVINGGTDNFAGAAALLCGVNGAEVAKPTSAYVRLLNGEFKYLLGTQRDIFRLRTRGAAFSIKPITEFNDLYQNISITCTDSKKKTYAKKFIEYFLNNNETLTSIGLLANGRNLYDDEMRQMEGLTYQNRLTSPISETMKNNIKSAISKCDINLLKNLLI